MYITVHVSEYSGVVSVVDDVADGCWADNLGLLTYRELPLKYEWRLRMGLAAVRLSNGLRGVSQHASSGLDTRRIQESGGFIEAYQRQRSRQEKPHVLDKHRLRPE